MTDLTDCQAFTQEFETASLTLAWTSERRSREAHLGGCGGMLPRKKIALGTAKSGKSEHLRSI